MKGLILKDLYVLGRQMRMFFLFILVFSVIPGSNMTVFAVVYAAMMPYTALAYDERSHWDQLAAMMPYSPREIVLGKYALGWLFTGAAAAVAVIAGAAESAMGLEGSAPAVSALSFCTGLVMMAVTLPPMFRFGVEKGRMFFIILMVAVSCGSAGLVSSVAENPYAGGLLQTLKLLLPAAAVVLTAVSVPLSVRLYGRRER